MTRDVHIIRPEDDVMMALDLMMDKDIRRLPVVQKERVVGIISRKDIVWGIYRDKAIRHL